PPRSGTQTGSQPSITTCDAGRVPQSSEGWRCRLSGECASLGGTGKTRHGSRRKAAARAQLGGLPWASSRDRWGAARSPPDRGYVSIGARSYRCRVGVACEAAAWVGPLQSLSSLMGLEEGCPTLMRHLLVKRQTLPESGLFRFFPQWVPRAASSRCCVLT